MILLCPFTVLVLTIANAQTDTTDKYVFNWQIATGFSHTNFSALHKYDYLLDRPANVNFDYISAVVFIGNPKKFFVSVLPFGYAFSRQRHGTYNGYNISAGGGHMYSRVQVSFPLTTHFDKKGLQGIYLSIGGQYIKSSIYSKASGINPAMHDTTFYNENSSARNFLGNVEIMLEAFRLGKQAKYSRTPFAVSVGYNFQFQKPLVGYIYQKRWR